MRHFLLAALLAIAAGACTLTTDLDNLQRSPSNDGGGDAEPPACSIAADCRQLIAHPECGSAACDGGVCVALFVNDGQWVSDQTPGDCRVRLCDGHGGVYERWAAADVHDDGDICTEDKCGDSGPVHPNVEAGTDCGAAAQCDLSGECAGCSANEDCATDGVCWAAVCETDGRCASLPIAAATVVGGTACMVERCDGNGRSELVPTQAGQACGGSGEVCDGNGNCAVPAPGSCHGSCDGPCMTCVHGGLCVAELPCDG